MKYSLGLILSCWGVILSSLAVGCSASEVKNEDGVKSQNQVSDEVGKTEEITENEPVSEVSVPDDNTASESASENDTVGSKILVASFSQTGNTQRVAQCITELLGADSYEIVAAKPYTDEDLDYGNSFSRTSIEQNDASSRPKIVGKIDDISVYDTVFVGYPIWWGIAPRIVSTFMESYDFSQKTIAAFCTSASSGLGKSAQNLHVLASDSVKWIDGKRFARDASCDDVETWLKSIGYDPEVIRAAKGAAEQHENADEETLKIAVNGSVLVADLVDNSSVDALKSLIGDGELTLEMSDYANMEKGGTLPQTLPQNNESMATEPGDVILYQGKTFVIYYETNRWSLTPIGKIRDVTAESFKALLGEGDVTVVLSL